MLIEVICNMLKKFVLRNYKNFKDSIGIDFGDVGGYQFSSDCISNNLIAKMLIYGRNATGKTNLGRAIMDISYLMLGMHSFTMSDGMLINADSDIDTASFSYTFLFDEQEVVYNYERFYNQELKYEELIIDKKIIFKCDFYNNEYDFSNLHYIGAETLNIDRYKESQNSNEEGDKIYEALKLPFARWLTSNAAFNNDSIMVKLYSFVAKMGIINVGGTMADRLKLSRKAFFQSLENNEKLKDLENFINAMGIECKLKLKKLPDGESELYFVHKRLVPFYSTASSGTLALVNLYRRTISKAYDASLIYIDEFDAFYHYEMAEKVVNFFKAKYPKSQIIMTTHNTNLMTNRLMRPDCMFILSRDGRLTPLCKATQRELREGHNLEKMYISGEFERYE